MSRGTNTSARSWLFCGALLLAACSADSQNEETLDEQSSNVAEETEELRFNDDSTDAPSSIGEIIDEVGAERDYVGCYETVFASAGVEPPDSFDDMPMALEELGDSAKLGFQECIRFVNAQGGND